MDNTNKPELSGNDDWFADLLNTQSSDDKIGPDEQAILSAGLSHPDDLELERIVQETLAENWDDPVVDSSEEKGSTQLFTHQELAELQQSKKTPAQPAPEPAFEVEPMMEIPEAAPEKTPEPEAEPVELQETDEEPAVKKTRPKMKKGFGLFGIPHLLSSIIWLAIIVFVGSVLGKFVWICAADVLAFGKAPSNGSITIMQDDDISDIAEKLEKAGLIDEPWLFELFADITGKGEDISIGTFEYTDAMIYDYNALIKLMTDDGPGREVVEIMFPEGFNCAQIFELLEEKGVCTVEELEKAATGELKNYWFLDGLDRNHKYCLEGYLAPDTYKFYVDDDPRKVLEKFLDEFDDRWTDHLLQKYTELQDRFASRMRSYGYGEAYIQENQLSFHEVVILASIIEKETANGLESYKISSVFFNRLTNPSRYPTLDSDATILYAVDYYNKGELITDEQINASPYNSYTQRGLPPGPIANPGLNSLGAALGPEDTDYYFFILDREANEHRFSKTLAEHERLEVELGYHD